MNEVTVSNFRCFAEKQTARLAPLTLLVGENGTGKTSFLALLRALWDVAIRERVPDFGEPPYDLESFDDIVHQGGQDGHRATFEAGCVTGPAPGEDCESAGRSLRHDFTFTQDGSGVIPSVRRLGNEIAWVEHRTEMDGSEFVRFATRHGEWEMPRNRVQDRLERVVASAGSRIQQGHLVPLRSLVSRLLRSLTERGDGGSGNGGVSRPGERDLDDAKELWTLVPQSSPLPRGRFPAGR